MFVTLSHVDPGGGFCWSQLSRILLTRLFKSCSSFWVCVVVGTTSWTGVYTQHPSNSSGTCCRICCGTVSHPFRRQMLVCTLAVAFSVTCWSCEMQKCNLLALPTHESNSICGPCKTDKGQAGIWLDRL